MVVVLIIFMSGALVFTGIVGFIACYKELKTDMVKVEEKITKLETKLPPFKPLFCTGELVRYHRTVKKGTTLEIGKIESISKEGKGYYYIFHYTFPWEPKSIATQEWIEAEAVLDKIPFEEEQKIKKKILIDTQEYEYV